MAFRCDESGNMNFWLAVANEVNCDLLAKMGHPYYALAGKGSKYALQAAPGDQCILYRAGKNSGFIGAFEIVSAAREKPVKLTGSWRPFAIQLPWKPIVLSPAHPVRVVPLVPDLEFVKSKSNYGMALRSNFRPLSKHDFDRIFSLLSEKAAKTTAG